jgi:hypothetical protein
MTTTGSGSVNDIGTDGSVAIEDILNDGSSSSLKDRPNDVKEKRGQETPEFLVVE